jgi:hypothetical protein
MGKQQYSSTLSLTSVLDRKGGQRQLLDCLPPVMTRYPLYRRLGRPQGRSGRARKIWHPTGIRSPDCPARSESLYPLRYPGPRLHLIRNYNLRANATKIIISACDGVNRVGNEVVVKYTTT